MLSLLLYTADGFLLIFVFIGILLLPVIGLMWLMLADQRV